MTDCQWRWSPAPQRGTAARSPFEIRHLKFSGAFTLVEMILAIGVAAIVLIAINTVLFSALRLREVTADAVDTVTPIDQAVTFIRRDLQCAVTPKANGIMSGDFKVGTVSSTGIADPVAAEMFTATGALSEKTPWGDVQRVTYELKNSTEVAGRRDLYRSVTRNLLPTTGTPEVEDQLMVSGVENVRFSCFTGTQWLDTWDTTDTTSAYTNLPTAVRVEIQLTSQNKNDSGPIQIVVPIDSVVRTNMVLTSSSSGS